MTAIQTAADNGYGIMIDAGGGYKVFFNSVSLGTEETDGWVFPRQSTSVPVSRRPAQSICATTSSTPRRLLATLRHLLQRGGDRLH
jgi:hypothetical protein